MLSLSISFPVLAFLRHRRYPFCKSEQKLLLSRRQLLAGVGQLLRDPLLLGAHNLTSCTVFVVSCSALSGVVESM